MNFKNNFVIALSINARDGQILSMFLNRVGLNENQEPISFDDYTPLLEEVTDKPGATIVDLMLFLERISKGGN
jgi:hypothetical protein